MKRQRIALIVVLVAVVVPLVGLLLAEAQLRERLSRRPEVGSVFPAPPEFWEEDHPASPSRRRVVVFAKAGCGNCDRTISTLGRLVIQEDYDLTAVVAGSAVESAGGEGGTLRFIPDPDGSLSKRFGVVQVPLVFILDGESRIEAALTGERPQAAWLSVLRGEARDL
ncbi:MAG: hypothetical protein OXI49_02420 [Acidobacteriota bacterium]|nr:hypothetical protein [Acidobacteriota bacterium]